MNQKLCEVPGTGSWMRLPASCVLWRAPPSDSLRYNFWFEKAEFRRASVQSCSGPGVLDLSSPQSGLFWAMHFSASPLNFIFNPAKGRLNGYMNGKMQEVLKQMVGWVAWVTCQTLDCVAIWMKIPPQLGFYFSNLWMTAAPGSPWQWDLEQLPAIIHLPSRLILLPLWIFLVPFSEKECHSRLISWWCKWFSRADEYQ